MKKTLTIFAIVFFTVIFSGSVNAQETNGINKPDTTTAESQYDQGVKIKKKPHPMFARSCSQSSGLTRVRATFDKSGKVTDVEVVISSGCRGFDENAVSAAKKIKFTPAMKNGEAVTVTKLVEYLFSIGRRGM